MQIDGIRSVKGNTDGDFDAVNVVEKAVNSPTAANALKQAQSVGGDEGKQEEKEGKVPSKNTVDSVMSEAKQKMRMTKTRCEYSYDESTKRVSISVFDKDTDELIREVPPEKSLEMLQKMWELAGIMVDEKR